MGLHWFILVAFVLILIQARLYYRYGLKGVSYTRHFETSRVREGETIQLVEKIGNRKWLPIPWIRVESQISAHIKFKQTFELVVSRGEKMQNHVSLFSLPPYVEIVRRHKVECLKRGRYLLSSAYLTTGDFLGWSRSAKPVQFRTELLVHPRLIPIEEILLPTNSWQGDVSVRRWIVEDPFIHAGVRQYRSGDPYNRIHWLASAKTGELQVRKNETTADHKLMILLNFEVTETMWKEITDEETVEHGIRYAASLAQHYVALGMHVGFGCNGQLADEEGKAVRLDPVPGEAQLQSLYDAMAMLQMKHSLPFETYLDEEIMNRSEKVDYLIISRYENESLTLRYEALRKNGHSVTVIPLTKPSEQAAAGGGM